MRECRALVALDDGTLAFQVPQLPTFPEPTNRNWTPVKLLLVCGGVLGCALPGEVGKRHRRTPQELANVEQALASTSICKEGFVTVGAQKDTLPAGAHEPQNVSNSAQGPCKTRHQRRVASDLLLRGVASWALRPDQQGLVNESQDPIGDCP